MAQFASLTLDLALFSHTSQMFHLIVKNWGDYKIYEMELVIGLLWNMCLVHFHHLISQEGSE